MGGRGLPGKWAGAHVVESPEGAEGGSTGFSYQLSQTWSCRAGEGLGVWVGGSCSMGVGTG